MGERKRKAQRYGELLSRHRYCCYCAGVREATTVDHAPPRICFRQRVGPEGFELPACEACNRASALSELVSAFYIRMCDTESRHFHGPDIERLISGVANNAPECLPDLGLSASDKRRALRGQGAQLAPGALLADAPVVRIPERVHSHIHVFLRKMLAALYYRETGGYLGPAHALILQWSQQGTPAAEFTEAKALEWFGDLKQGSRANVDLDGQFAFRMGHHPAHGYFGLWMAFGASFNFFAAAGPKTELARLNDRAFVHDWRPLDEAVLGVSAAADAERHS